MIQRNKDLSYNLRKTVLESVTWYYLKFLTLLIFYNYKWCKTLQFDVSHFCEKHSYVIW